MDPLHERLPGLPGLPDGRSSSHGRKRSPNARGGSWRYHGPSRVVSGACSPTRAMFAARTAPRLDHEDIRDPPIPGNLRRQLHSDYSSDSPPGSLRHVTASIISQYRSPFDTSYRATILRMLRLAECARGYTKGDWRWARMNTNLRRSPADIPERYQTGCRAYNPTAHRLRRRWRRADLITQFPQGGPA